MALGLLIVPVVGALVAFVWRDNAKRPLVLPAVALVHLGFTVALLGGAIAPPDSRWLWLDPPARIVLGLVSLLFASASVYAVGYLRFRSGRPNTIFVCCLAALLAALTLTILARHLGLMWVGMEAAALAGAPLIYFNHNPRSIEATWKYLLIGSVGVAVALLGTFFIAYAALGSGTSASLRFDELAAMAPHLAKPWLRAGFALVVVGYGTKMGLAPMHTWKPDAYGEAPGVAGALFAGGVTSVAFLAILRVVRICHAAGEGPYATRLLVGIGLFSMAMAGALMVGQRDFKRMLAYSSVEHMGIVALGVGIGGLGTFGAMLHLVANGLTKGVLFLSAANLHRGYGSKLTGDVSGALRGMPLSGGLFLLGFFAITGAPPFAPFLSELTIARAAFAGGHGVAGGLFLLFLMLVFVGMGATVLRVTLGPAKAPTTTWNERRYTSVPIVALLGVVLLLGVVIPSPLSRAFDAVVAHVEQVP